MKRALLALLPLLLAALTTSSGAKDNAPEMHLSWSPQQRVGTTEANLSSEMLRIPVAVEVVDRRGLDDPAVLGIRTDDDDRRLELRSLDPIPAFVERWTTSALADWGVEARAGAERTLKLALLRFHVLESNQAVGATYEAQCRFEATLEDADGSVLWSGAAAGDATRYGKKFSAPNTSEVLSDALLEAIGQLLGDAGLHRAWSGERVASGSEPTSTVIAPDDLLAEVQRLVDRGVGEDQLVRFVTGRSLSRALDADDLLAWREAGVPDVVVDAVLDLPVR